MGIKLPLIAKEIFKATRTTLHSLIGIDLSVSHQEGPKGNVEALSSILTDAFVTQVKVDNIADNDLWLLVEKKGAIFLSGKLLLLPEKTLEDALEKGEFNESTLDAQREICNMLVGAIDDVLREKIDNSLHLTMGEAFLYGSSETSLPEQEYISYVAEVKVENLSFNMAVIIAQELISKIEAYLGGETPAEEEKKEIPSEEEKQVEEKPPERKSEVIQLTLPKEAKGLTAETIAERDFPAIHAEATLAEALEKMQENNSDHLFVVDGLKLLGIITMADVKSGLSPFLEEPFREYCRPLDEATRKFKVAWFMKKDVPYVPPEATILEVTQVLAERPIASLPVCYNGRIIGSISLSKLLLILAQLAFDKNAEEPEDTPEAAVA